MNEEATRELVTRWRDRAEHFRQMGWYGETCYIEECATELEAILEGDT